jgi:hypothetical protein
MDTSHGGNESCILGITHERAAGVFPSALRRPTRRYYVVCFNERAGGGRTVRRMARHDMATGASCVWKAIRTHVSRTYIGIGLEGSGRRGEEELRGG